MALHSTPNVYIRCQGVDNEFVTVSTSNLPENPYDLIHLLKLETAPRACWRDVASSYLQTGKWDAAVTVLEEATSEDVENILPGGPDDQGSSFDDVHSPCSRLDLLAALAGIHIMMAEAHVQDPDFRRESLRKATDVFSRAIKIDLDDPSIWAARGWAEFHSEKSGAASWFDSARDKHVILGSIGMAALQMNCAAVTPTEVSRKDPVSLLVFSLRSDVCPPGVWTGLAYALYKEGRLNAARNVARRALAALRRSPPEERLEALYLLAMIEFADRTETSVDDVAIILREAYINCGGDRDTRILSLVSNMMFNGGDFKRAEQFAQRAVDAADCLPLLSVGALFAGIRDCAKVDALFQLARAQHHLRKFSEAMHGFAEIKSLADRTDGKRMKVNPGILLRLGLLKLSTGRSDDVALAKDCLEKVLKASNDRCGIAKRALGVLIGRDVLLGLRKGRPRGGENYERAVSLLSKGLEELEVGKYDVPAQLVFAGLVEEYFPQKALDSYRKVIKYFEVTNSPVDHEIWSNYAALLARCGNVEEAQEIYHVKIDEKFVVKCASVAYNRGRLAEMAGNVPLAENVFRSFSKDHPHYNEAIVRLAVILMSKPDGDAEAEKLLKEAKDAHLTKAVAIAHLSALYASQKNYKQAQEALEAHRNDCDYLSLLFSSFMHRFLDSLDDERRSRFLINHIGTPLIHILKRNNHNACAANGVGVYFAESKMLTEARDAFTTAGSGPLADRVTRVNLAHIQMQLGIREVKDSAKITGRPSLRSRTTSRSLYEQADKLYSDALSASSLDGSKKNFNSYCELLLYSAWAQYEGGLYTKSVGSLYKLLHLMPSSSVAWFNLSKALLELALERVVNGGDRLDELQQAKNEFEGSRSSLTRFSVWKRNYPDPLARIRVSSQVTNDLGAYVRQEAKSHDVKLRNAVNMEDDRKERLAARTRELKAYEDRRKEKEQEKEAEKTRKELELRRAFEESQRKQKENEENYQRMLAAKRAAAEEELSGDEEVPSSEKKSRSKRKRKDLPGEEDGGSKKAKRTRKTPVKKVEKEVYDSGDEYSDVPNDNDLTDEVDGPIKPDDTDLRKGGLDFKHKKVEDSSDEGESDGKRKRVEDMSDGEQDFGRTGSPNGARCTNGYPSKDDD